MTITHEMQNHLTQIKALTNSPVRSRENILLCAKRALIVAREVRRLETAAKVCKVLNVKREYQALADELSAALKEAAAVPPMFTEVE